MAARFAERPHGHVTGVLTDPAEREAAFRFIENDGVDVAAMAAASHAAAAQRCADSSVVIVAVDQSTLSITDRQGTKGFGRTAHNTRRKRGVEVMSALAIDDQGVSQGLVAQQWWVRSEERSPEWRTDKRPERERESDLWRRTLLQAHATLREHGPDAQPWFQLDRGADAGAVLRCAKDQGYRITVRAAYDRAVEGGKRILHALRAAPVLGRCELRVPRGYKRKPRTAQLEVRSTQVRVRVPDDVRHPNRKRPLDYFVVRIREPHPPRGATRIEWTLLTTVETRTFADAMSVVSAYTKRWRVEDFHHAWKSGVCDIESSQLRSHPAFRRWATIAAAVATRAERLKTVSRASPEVSALTEFTRSEVDAAIALSRTKRHRPGDDLTLADAVLLVAQIGGYTGKSSGGPPGVKLIARGLHDVTVGAAAIEAHLARSG
jgi:hypothetical protein